MPYMNICEYIIGIDLLNMFPLLKLSTIMLNSPCFAHEK